MTKLQQLKARVEKLEAISATKKEKGWILIIKGKITQEQARALDSNLELERTNPHYPLEPTLDCLVYFNTYSHPIRFKDQSEKGILKALKWDMPGGAIKNYTLKRQ